MAGDNEQACNRAQQDVNPSTRQVRPPSGVSEKPSEGPAPFWITFIVVLNVLIFVGFGYALWNDRNWDLE